MLLCGAAPVKYCAVAARLTPDNEIKKWYYLGGYNKQLVKQLDLRSIRETIPTISYSIRVLTKKYYIYENGKKFNSVVKEYTVNCNGGYHLDSFKLKDGETSIYEKAVDENIFPESDERVADILCKGVPDWQFSQGLVMSDEDTSRELGE